MDAALTLAKANELPNEMLLYIIPFFTLKSLITARAVNRRWRHLVKEAYIDPTRQRLLNCYLSLVASSMSMISRKSHHTVSFLDYDKILSIIPLGSQPVPPDFSLWLREWPAHAAWTGLTLSPSIIPHHCACSSTTGSHATSDDWCNCAVYEPYLTRVTFSSGTKLFSEGGALYATRMLPMEFSDLPTTSRSSTYAEGEDVESSIDALVLSFGGRLALILDGRRCGEQLAGIVYMMRGSYMLCAENILARSWTEYLEKNLNARRFA